MHTASDVPITAYCANPDVWVKFCGTYKNTDVFFKLAQGAFGGY